MVQKQKVFNYRPTLVTALSLMLGVLFGAIFTATELAFLIAAIALAVILVFTAIVFRRKLKVVFLVLVSIIGFFGYSISYYSSKPIYFYSESVYVEGRVDEVGSTTEYGAVFYLENVTIDGVQTSDRLRLVNPDFSAPELGVKMFGNVSIETISFDPFDSYTVYLYRNKVKYKGNVLNIKSDGNPFLTLPEKVTQRIRDGLGKVLNRDQIGVAESLLFGDKTNLDSDDYDDIKISGLAHIFAVSGLHVGFLVVLLMWILKKLRFNQYVRFALVFVVLMLYGVLCGFSASIIRAIVMTSVVMLARLLKRRPDALSSLAAAIVVILCINPFSLFDLSFLMSAGSVAGIILFGKPLYKTCKKLLRVDKVSLSVATSISATAGIFPVMTNVYNTFSVYFIIGNLIALPLVSVLYTLLMIGVMFVFISPALAFLLYPAKYLIIALLYFSRVLASLPYASIAVYSMGILAVVYVAILVNVSRFNMLDSQKKAIATAYMSAAAVFAYLALYGGANLF